MGTFSTTMQSILVTLFSSVDSVATVNLGYVAGVIGVADFINNLLSSIYIAGSVYVSAMVSILTFQYTTKIYATLMTS